MNYFLFSVQINYIFVFYQPLPTRCWGTEGAGGWGKRSGILRHITVKKQDFYLTLVMFFPLVWLLSPELALCLPAR